MGVCGELDSDLAQRDAGVVLAYHCDLVVFCFKFDCLRVLGVYEGPTADGGLLASSRQALLAMLTVSETSMLTGIRQALEADSFFGPVVTHLRE